MWCYGWSLSLFHRTGANGWPWRGRRRPWTAGRHVHHLLLENCSARSPSSELTENLHLYRSQTGLSDYGRKYVTFPRMVGRAQAFEMFTHTNPCEHDYMGRTKLLRWNGMEWDKIFQRGQFPGATWLASQVAISKIC